MLSTSSSVDASDATSDPNMIVTASIPTWPTCGDKSSSNQAPNPDPVSDQECGEGYVYNPGAATRFGKFDIDRSFICFIYCRVCHGTPCMVGSEGDLDQACCMADAHGGGIPYWIFTLIFIVFLLITILCCLCIWLLARKTRQPEAEGDYVLEQTIELRESP